MSARSPIDTSDMLAVHEALRRVLRTAPEVIERVAPDDADQVAVVASYFANALAFLQVHHEGEDDLLWPKLLERVDDRDLVVRIAAQHGDVEANVEAAQARLADWAAAPTVDSGVALARAMTELGAIVEPHLAEEEAEILPLAAVTVTQEEWGGLTAHGMSNFSGDKMWLILGLIREGMSQAERDTMLSRMPPQAREFWLTMGEAQFNSFIATVRG